MVAALRAKEVRKIVSTLCSAIFAHPLASAVQRVLCVTDLARFGCAIPPHISSLCAANSSLAALLQQHYVTGGHMPGFAPIRVRLPLAAGDSISPEGMRATLQLFTREMLSPHMQTMWTAAAIGGNAALRRVLVSAIMRRDREAMKCLRDIVKAAQCGSDEFATAMMHDMISEQPIGARFCMAKRVLAARSRTDRRLLGCGISSLAWAAWIVEASPKLACRAFVVVGGREQLASRRVLSFIDALMRQLCCRQRASSHDDHLRAHRIAAIAAAAASSPPAVARRCLRNLLAFADQSQRQVELTGSLWLSALGLHERQQQQQQSRRQRAVADDVRVAALLARVLFTSSSSSATSSADARAIREALQRIVS
ncbi:MAG: hypothetical protein Q8J97_14350, partial [Flavobacteriaceae bacterium]|nr:hypothetical protein [Flavobacteriaceae bacterium]